MPMVKNQMAPRLLSTVFTFDVPLMLSYTEHMRYTEIRICAADQNRRKPPISSPLIPAQVMYAADGTTAATVQAALAMRESGLVIALLPWNISSSCSLDFRYFFPNEVDEPISALDVSIQAQVINMFEDLQDQMGLTYLFIAHDLSVVKHISDRILVMYLGRMVEMADSYELTMHSLHPYTRSLVSAIPIADPIEARKSNRIILEGDVPSPVNPPSGCRFRTRCPYADERCAQEIPEFKEVSSGHFVACHHLDKVE